MKSQTRFLIAAFAALLVTGAPASAEAAYPDRPIDLIVPWGAGGGADKFARTLTPELEKILKVAVPVSNTPGAAGNAGLGRLISVPADGYTLAVMTGVTFATFTGTSPYKVVDFDWIVRTQITPSMLFVSKDSPFKTWSDVAEFARKNPGKLKVGTDGLGAPGDLSLRYLAAKGIKMVNVPFDKPGERYTAPLGGHVDLLYEEPGDVREFLVSGRLRPILTFDRKRFPDYANVPASYELGFEVALFNWRGFVSKRGTAASVTDVLGDATRRAMKSKRWMDFCAKEWSCDEEALIGKKFEDWAADQLRQLKTFSEQY
jgi:tripartite-type tricarboxylate transporter receptor subunit TctC